LLQSHYQVKLNLASASYKLGAFKQFQQRAQQEIETTILSLQTTIAQMQDNNSNKLREVVRRCNVAITEACI
jgi:hypothetical protein